MSCYYCGGQRLGCPECRPKAKEPVAVGTFQKPVVISEAEMKDDISRQPLIEAIRALDGCLDVSIVYDEVEQCDVLRTRDTLTHESLEWNMKKLLTSYGTLANASRNIVRYWNTRRKAKKIPGY